MPFQQPHLKHKIQKDRQQNNEKKTFHTNTNQKKASTTILVSDKIDFEAKKHY